jgi:hypothetical protein
MEDPILLIEPHNLHPFFIIGILGGSEGGGGQQHQEEEGESAGHLA